MNVIWTCFCSYYLHDTELEELTSIDRYISLEDIEYAFFIDGDGVRTMDSICITSYLSTHFDRLQLMELIERLGDVDAIENLYKDAGMRVGAICCYTPEGKEKADYYEGFNFTDVWTMKNGMPEHVFQKLNKETVEDIRGVQQALYDARENIPEEVDLEAQVVTFQAALDALRDPDAPVKEQNRLLKACIARIDFYREQAPRQGGRHLSDARPLVLDFTLRI